MIYLIDAKPYESKQCRYEIESTGLLPDEPAIKKRRDVMRGTLAPARVRVRDESMALDAIEDRA